MAVWNGQGPLGKPAPTLLGLSCEKKEVVIRLKTPDLLKGSCGERVSGMQEAEQDTLGTRLTGLEGRPADDAQEAQHRCSVTLSDTWVEQGCDARRELCPTRGQRSLP